ncbi:MAG TPA: alpha/beta fold hydrolase [Methylomirabilota bacterium]|nr:alpha/beta fold hydrolase [Methylomirabilota bacterium]
MTRDPRIESAVTNWGPRFVAQGVDYNDVLRTVAGIERWDGWLDAWCAAGDAHAGLAREAEARGRRRTAGEAWVRAALSYHFARFVWLVDPARHARAGARAVAALAAAHRHLDPTAERLEVPLDGAVMAANLRRPAAVDRPPLAILVPGLDSTKEEFFWWEQVFLDRGLATVSLDGPGQGETGTRLPIRHDYETAVAALLDALAGRRDVDLGRVGAAGVSLGGYYAPRAAAFEPRLRAVVAIGGPLSFAACWDQLPGLTREGFAHHARARDADDARAKAARLDLSPVLGRIRQPFLVVFGKLDRLIPWPHAEAVAKGAPRGELVMYPEGNHVCNNIPYNYRPLVGDWLAEQLRA